jgi:tripartite-type tricarboxylate transporter receptor subunit TctC
MRNVGEKLTSYWGQQVIIENKQGGNGWIAMDATARSEPDGYTFVQVDNALIALTPHLYKKLPYDPNGFEPVATMYRAYYFVTVAADAKWNNVGDLVRDAKANPESITYGSSGNGGNIHLGGAMLETAAGVKMTHIPYKETLQMYVDVSRGEVDWAMGTASTTAPLLKSGKIKYLAISAPQRHSVFPNIPTVADAEGPEDVQLQTWIALFAPRGTPQAIINKVNADIARALREPDVQASMKAVGFDPLIQTPMELKTMVDSQSQSYKSLVSQLNISLD